MFCSNCGNQIQEGGQFCSSCGTPVTQQAVAESVEQQLGQEVIVQQPIPESVALQSVVAQPSAIGVMMKSFWGIVKGVFSKNIVKTVGEQAKNTGNEWIISLIISVLSFAFAFSVNINQTITSIIKEVAGGMISSGIISYLKYPFFSFLGVSLLIGLVVLAVVVLGIRVMATIVTKKNVSWICVLNLVGAATIPLSACYIVNMILGLIWVPITVFVSIVALLMTVILLYVGAQKLEKPVMLPFYPFTIVVTVIVAVAVLVSFLLLKAVFTSWLGSALGSGLDLLGSLGSFF